MVMGLSGVILNTFLFLVQMLHQHWLYLLLFHSQVDIFTLLKRRTAMFFSSLLPFKPKKKTCQISRCLSMTTPQTDNNILRRLPCVYVHLRCTKKMPHTFITVVRTVFWKNWRVFGEIQGHLRKAPLITNFCFNNKSSYFMQWESHC